MASMRDVAKLAGVSLSTVSIVLNNGSKFVSGSHRDKVLNAAEELGYRLPTKKLFSQKTIAVILPVITSSFFSNVLNGIESTISTDENLLLYYNSNYDFDKEYACIKVLRKQSLTGIILNSICPPEKEEEYFSWLKKEFVDNGIPVVMLERKVEKEGFYCVCIDNFWGAYTATRHLIEQGHKRIAYIKGNDKMLHTYERYEGYKSAMREAGLEIDEELVGSGDFTPFSGYCAMKQLLDIRTDFTALCSSNDQMAIGAIKAIKSYGKKVPEDIAVVGFDNLSVSSLIEPALSTIHVPTFQFGRTAVKIILNAAEGKESQKVNILETNLIVRRSSCEGAANEWDLMGW